jgi:tetratricopeptide (TPR) repeat protein
MGEFKSRALVALGATLGLAAGGCSQIGMLKGKMAFQDANKFYQGQDYRQAAEKYEETISECRGSSPDCTDTRLTPAYFFLGNSYDQQYRSVKRGEAENDALLTKAIENYKKAASLEGDPKIKRLALDYLVSSYGPDKLNDPAQAEPILLSMIEMDPKETSSYFGLANIYEQSGDYERAEQMLTKAREMRPGDSAVYMQLAGFYNRQGDFAKTMDALNARTQQEPTNPEAHYTVATYYWEKAYRDFTTPEADKMKFVQQGLQAVDQAIKLNPNYFEALTYKNLLLRVQANLEKNPARQQALLREANEWRDKAQEVRNKAKAAGAE